MKTILIFFAACLTLAAQNPNTAIFPGAVAADSDLLVAKDNARTTLNGAINASVTTLVLSSATAFPTPVAITIDNEVLRCPSHVGTTYTCSRAFAGSTAAVHANQATVHGNLIDWHVNQANAEIKAVELSIFPSYNAKSRGLKGDERFVVDAAMTSGGNTVTSASAAFTTLDTGKTVTIQAGARGVSSAVYSSGGSVTGSANTYCAVSGFNGGGSGATGYISVRASNTLAASEPIVMITLGTGYTSTPTTASLGNGNQGTTCSGTIAVTGTLYALPITGTATYVSATSVTLSTTATSTVSGAAMAIGTDDSSALTSLITTVYTAGGGEIYFPPGFYLIKSAITLPNDGSSQVAKQPPISFRGDGGRWDGEWTDRVAAASTLDLRYAGSYGKIVTYGSGSFKATGISFADSGFDQTPFIFSTNTTVTVRDNSFIGSGPGALLSQNDAVALGGSSLTVGNSPTAPFQGYGTQIDHNYFSKIVRGLYGKTYTNSVVLSNNTWSWNCGGRAAFEMDGTGGQSEALTWYGNLIEILNYQYGAIFTNAYNASGFGNTFWDQSFYLVRAIALRGTSTGHLCLNCLVEPSAQPAYIDEGSGNSPMSIQSGRAYGVWNFDENITVSGAILFGATTKFAQKSGGINYLFAGTDSLRLSASSGAADLLTIADVTGNMDVLGRISLAGTTFLSKVSGGKNYLWSGTDSLRVTTSGGGTDLLIIDGGTGNLTAIGSITAGTSMTAAGSVTAASVFLSGTKLASKNGAINYLWSGTGSLRVSTSGGGTDLLILDGGTGDLTTVGAFTAGTSITAAGSVTAASVFLSGTELASKNGAINYLWSGTGSLRVTNAAGTTDILTLTNAGNLALFTGSSYGVGASTGVTKTCGVLPTVVGGIITAC
jgi:hypothetical protein